VAISDIRISNTLWKLLRFGKYSFIIKRNIYPPLAKGFTLKGIKGDFILKIYIIPHNLPLKRGEAREARIASLRGFAQLPRAQ
jgi:hypothetical protein